MRTSAHCQRRAMTPCDRMQTVQLSTPLRPQWGSLQVASLQECENSQARTRRPSDRPTERASVPPPLAGPATGSVDLEAPPAPAPPRPGVGGTCHSVSARRPGRAGCLSGPSTPRTQRDCHRRAPPPRHLGWRAARGRGPGPPGPTPRRPRVMPVLSSVQTPSRTRGPGRGAASGSIVNGTGHWHLMAAWARENLS